MTATHRTRRHIITRYRVNVPNGFGGFTSHRDHIINPTADGVSAVALADRTNGFVEVSDNGVTGWKFYYAPEGVTPECLKWEYPEGGEDTCTAMTDGVPRPQLRRRGVTMDETILGSVIHSTMMEHYRTADGCACGNLSFWDREHIEHTARVIARELKARGI